MLKNCVTGNVILGHKPAGEITGQAGLAED